MALWLWLSMQQQLPRQCMPCSCTSHDASLLVRLAAFPDPRSSTKSVSANLFVQEKLMLRSDLPRKQRHTYQLYLLKTSRLTGCSEHIVACVTMRALGRLLRWRPVLQGRQW